MENTPLKNPKSRFLLSAILLLMLVSQAGISQLRYWKLDIGEETISQNYITMQLSGDSLLLDLKNVQRSIHLDEIYSIRYARRNSIWYGISQGIIYAGITGAIITPMIMKPKKPSGGWFDLTPSEPVQRLFGVFAGGLIGTLLGVIPGAIIGALFNFDEVYIFTDLSLTEKRTLATEIIVKYKM
jgi:hypothetical protein